MEEEFVENESEESLSVELTVHAYDWIVKDVYGDEDRVNIHCWSLDQNSNSHLLRFTTFPAFCYVELPMFVRGRIYPWKPSTVAQFMDVLCTRLGDDHAPYRYIFKQAKKTYYHRGGRTFPMVQLCFNSLKSLQKCTRLLDNPLKTDDWGFIKCNVWEHDISIVRKLLTVQNVRYSQWFTVKGKKVPLDSRLSSLENEYIVEWDTMKPVPPEVSKGWTTNPGVLAFDIECYSNKHRAMPDKYDALHLAYMISGVFQRLRCPETRSRYCVVIGDCNHIPPEKLANCQVITIKYGPNAEIEMVEAFSKIIRETDPEILTGYNILGFDYPYLDHRVKRCLKSWPMMGRVLGETSFMTTKTWFSGAYGHQSINILQMEGRISIDLLPIVRRDYANIFERYDLNTVCKKFIKKTKHPIKAEEMFIIVEHLQQATETLLTLRKNPNLKDDNYNIKLNEAIKDFEEAKAEMTQVVEYCIQDSELVIDLMEKINIWIGLVEMSNIVGTTIVELFTRGQQVRCYSQLYDLAAKMGYVLDKRDTSGFRFSGGSVHEPIPGLYDDVIVLDFASLYPSIIMAFNICWTTLVAPEMVDIIPDIDCNIIDCEQEENEDGTNDDDEEEALEEIGKKKKKIVKTVIKRYRYKYYKREEGLLPRLVRQLVTERRAVNRQIVNIKDEIKASERTDSILNALTKYLSGTEEKDSTEIFNYDDAKKDLTEATETKPPIHPTLLEVAKLKYDIAEFYKINDQNSIKKIFEQLSETKNERMKKREDNKLLMVVLDKRQLALKVSANSFFGFLGVHNGGLMPLIEGAMSITSKGRELIAKVREFIETKYDGVQIYGDTDSVMMKLPIIKNSKECNYWGIRLAQEISGIKPGEKDCDGILHPDGRPGLFPPPLAMEFEKAMRVLCLRKKKYAAYLITKDGNFKMEDITNEKGDKIGTQRAMLKKGIILARRDNCGFIRDTYTKILNLILDKGTLSQAMSILIDSVLDLIHGRIPYEKLVIIRTLGANYKSDSYFLKVFSDNLKKAGKIVNPGDRLDFLITVDPDAKLVGHKMRLVEQYLESLNTDIPCKIDYNYYIEKILMNPINQLFEVGFKNVIPQLAHVSYLPPRKRKPIYLDRPVLILQQMIVRGYTDLEMFKKGVIYHVENLGKPIPPPSQLKLIIINNQPKEEVKEIKMVLPNLTPPVKQLTPPVKQLTLRKNTLLNSAIRGDIIAHGPTIVFPKIPPITPIKSKLTLPSKSI